MTLRNCNVLVFRAFSSKRCNRFKKQNKTDFTVAANDRLVKREMTQSQRLRLWLEDGSRKGFNGIRSGCRSSSDVLKGLNFPSSNRQTSHSCVLVEVSAARPMAGSLPSKRWCRLIMQVRWCRLPQYRCRGARTKASVSVGSRNQSPIWTLVRRHFCRHESRNPVARCLFLQRLSRQASERLYQQNGDFLPFSIAAPRLHGILVNPGFS